MTDLGALKRDLQQQGVEYLYGYFVDIHGVAKSKCVPLAHLESFVKGSETYTVGALEGMGPLGPNEDECIGVPDLSSITVLPWNKKHAVFAADLLWHGEPYSHDSRAVLKRQVEAAKSMGFNVNMGIEPEFYVLRSANGKLEPLISEDRLSPPTRGYDLEATIDAERFLDPMKRYIDELGWSVYSIIHEGGDGQYEINFRHSDVLTMADRMPVLRAMIKHVAKSVGCFATFMPKPYANDFGSGAHMNLSLADYATGANIFENSKATNKFDRYTKVAKQFTGGILNHAGAITAVACPTVNSYKRLEPFGLMRDMSWAPIYEAYGFNNRTLMCRLPTTRHCLELRHPDSMSNTYLTAALAIAAGLEGIKNNVDPGEPVEFDTYKEDNQKILSERGIKRLPKTLKEALDEFETNDLCKHTLGEEFHATYLKYKTGEWGAYCLSVTDWELNQYLRLI